MSSETRRVYGPNGQSWIQGANGTLLSDLYGDDAPDDTELLDEAQFVSPPMWQDKPLPRREWFVEHCFSAGNVGMLSGVGGIGKTVLLLQLCAAAATGRDWLGLKVKPCRAFFLACEDDEDECQLRLNDVSKSMQLVLDDLGNITIMSRVGLVNSLVEFDRSQRRRTSLYQLIMKKITSIDAKLIVIDTASQTFSGNQNDEVQVVGYINQIRLIAQKTNGTVIITKHPSVAGKANGTGESGSVAWNNAVRSRLYFRNNSDKDSGRYGKRELAGMKSNYGPLLDPIPLRWENGVFVRDDVAIRRWDQ